MLLSSRRHFRKVTPEGSRTLRACVYLSIDQGREKETHPVQVVDKPGQIITLEVPYTFYIVLPIKCIEELVLELR